MSLKSDIFNAYVESMGVDSMDKESSDGLMKLSENLSNAIKKFLVRQEFRVVRLDTDLDVESISTTGNIRGDLVLSPEKILGALNNKESTTFKESVTLPKLNLKSGFGDGGSLIVKGGAVIKQQNYKNSNKSSGKSKKTVVKLFEGEIKD